MAGSCGCWSLTRIYRVENSRSPGKLASAAAYIAFTKCNIYTLLLCACVPSYLHKTNLLAKPLRELHQNSAYVLSHGHIHM